MLRKTTRIALRILLLLALASLLVFAIPTLIVELYAQSRVRTLENAPGTRVAIVFGAGLTRSGTPSIMLRDRVQTAAKLYLNGKVEKLLMSGDNRFVDYNEPGAMQEYAIGLGVPEEDIVLDYAGRRTYDTCYRARQIFGISDAILVTQSFHLPRAIFTCNSLGVQSTGVPAESLRYRRVSYGFWDIREIPATSVALWELWISRPLPVLGDPEPIFTHNSHMPLFINPNLTSRGIPQAGKDFATETISEEDSWTAPRPFPS